MILLGECAILQRDDAWAAGDTGQAEVADRYLAAPNWV